MPTIFTITVLKSTVFNLAKTFLFFVFMFFLAGCATNIEDSTNESKDLKAPILELSNAVLIYNSGATVSTIIPNVNTDSAEVKGCLSAYVVLPDNISVSIADDKKSCKLSGSAEGKVLKKYTIRAINAYGKSDLEVNFAIGLVTPTIDNIASEEAWATGSTQSFSITNTVDTLIESCSTTPALPAGLSIGVSDDQKSCVISGVPEEEISTTNFVITATNPIGSDSATFPLSVFSPVPTAPPSLEDEAIEQVVTLGNSFSYTFTNSAVNAVDTCSMAPTIAGLTASVFGSTCKISGIPTQYVSGTYTITATNEVGSDTATVVISVLLEQPVLNDAVPLERYVRRKESFEYIFSSAVSTLFVGGTPAGCNLTAASPALANGLTLTKINQGINGDTCKISGIPLVTSSRLIHTVKADNQVGAYIYSDTAQINIEVVDSVPMLEDEVSEQVFIIGLNNSYDFTVSTGYETSLDSFDGCTVNITLPTGISIAKITSGATDTCRIGGIPVAPTSSTLYTIEAKNTINPTHATISGSATAIDTATITLKTGYPIPNLVSEVSEQVLSTTQDYLYGFVNTETNAKINTGGCVTSPSLPNNLNITVSQVSPTYDTCRISGTPIVSSPETTYTITASNNSGSSSATITIEIFDYGIPSFVSSPPPSSARIGVPFNLIYPVSGGVTSHQIDQCNLVLPATLPAGLSLGVTTISSSMDTCQISGASATELAYQDYIITATNKFGTGNQATMNFGVSRPLPTLSSASEQTAIYQQPFDFSLTGSDVDLCVVSPSLPTGIQISAAAGTCRVFGTATVSVDISSIATNYIISASNTVTPTNGAPVDIKSISQGSVTFPFKVVYPNPSLQDSIVSYAIVVNSPFTYEFTNLQDSVHLNSCSITPALPNGLSVGVASVSSSMDTCVISGAPTSITAAATYTVSGSTITGSSDAAQVTLSVIAENCNNCAFAGCILTF